jgi:flagellar hook-length control protein FliK
MGEASEGQGSEFTSVLASSLIDRQAAQSGNQLPQSGEREADIADGDTRPLLRNLRLQSGLQIVVGGTGPSEAGLSAFAQSQGIDPAVLESLLDDHTKGAATNAAHTTGFIQQLGSGGVQAAEALTKEQLRAQLGRMSPLDKEEAGLQLIKEQIRDSLARLSPTGKEQAQAAEVADGLTKAQIRIQQLGSGGVQAAEALTKEQLRAQLGRMSPLDKEEAGLQLSKEQIRDSLARLSPSGKEQAQAAEVADGLTKAQIREQLARITAAEGDISNAGTAADNPSLAPAIEMLINQRQMADVGLTSGMVNPSRAQTVATQPLLRAGAPTDKELSLSAKQLAEAIREGNTLAGKTPSNTQVGAQPELQAAAGRLLFKNLMDKHSAGGHVPLERANSAAPVIKLEAISLLAPAAPVVTAESAFIPAQQSFAQGQDALTAGRLPEDPLQRAMRKQEESQEMSRRLTEALGQRLTAQITRGAWRVEMDLHPKSLGRIEIQLEMKNGELEANFHSANSATRELLADSMPRLRAALEQHGMETAYLGLELGNQGRSDENSTGQEQGDRSERDNPVEKAESLSTAGKNKISDDGLNVLV